jgi:phosphatidylserine/phosphatidylglycerophosphate/cardiolipin synthase-like enzyme
MNRRENVPSDTVDSAQRSIRVAAYSFTPPDIVRHLLEAKRRGVEVAVVVEEKNNLSEDRSGKAPAATEWAPPAARVFPPSPPLKIS